MRQTLKAVSGHDSIYLSWVNGLFENGQITVSSNMKVISAFTKAETDARKGHLSPEQVKQHLESVGLTAQLTTNN